MNPSPSSPTPADLQEAASTFPDGPNVAPSAHEHEAAQGQSSPTGGAAGSEPDARDAGERQERIRNAAYALSSRRGFASGRDLDDWLEAERTIDGAAKPPQAP